MRSQKPSSRGANGTRNRPCCTIQLVIAVTSGERSSSAPEERSGNAAICASAMAAQNLARARSGWNGARDISRAGPAPQLRWGDTRPSSTPEQEVKYAPWRFFRSDLRLLRHADRLGVGDLRRVRPVAGAPRRERDARAD